MNHKIVGSCLSAVAAVAGFGTASAPVYAQKSMAVGEDAGGGFPGDLPPGFVWRGSCKPPSVARSDAIKGKPRPTAIAVWQVASPGVVNYCVRAGVAGIYKTFVPPPGPGPSPQAKLAVGTPPILTPIPLTPYTASLLDNRSTREIDTNDEVAEQAAWMNYMMASQSGILPGPFAPSIGYHQKIATRTDSLTEPLNSKAVSMAETTWCETGVKWSSRPFLVIGLSGPETRGNKWGAIACSIGFGQPESPAANLESVIAKKLLGTTSVDVAKKVDTKGSSARKAGS